MIFIIKFSPVQVPTRTSRSRWDSLDSAAQNLKLTWTRFPAEAILPSPSADLMLQINTWTTEKIWNQKIIALKFVIVKWL